MSHKYGIRFMDDFDKLISSSDDSIMVRELLNKYVTEDSKARIILHFNKHAAEYNLRVLNLNGISNVSFTQH